MKDSLKWDRITSIEHLPAEDVYDIEIDGTHNFIGNGIVAHNTYILGQTNGALSASNGTVSAGTLSVANGGTGSTTLSSTILMGNGTSAVQSYTGSTCTNQFVRSLNGAGVATCASVSLTADVSGILPVANGGTGWANITANTLLTGNGSGALATTTVGSSLQLASATLGLNLGNSNWWTARQNFTNASTSQLTATSSVWFTGLTSALLSTDQNGLVSATTSIGVNYLSGILPIANGGTATSTQVTNGVNFFDGTRITSGTALTFNGTTFGTPLFNATQTSGTSTIASGQGFTIGGSQFVLQQGSGNVGVGTTSPTAAPLVVNGSSFLQAVLAANSGTTQSAGISFRPDGGHQWEIQGTPNSSVSNSLIFYDRTAGQYRAVIDGNGNVGVGTTSPSTTFGLVGSQYLTGGLGIGTLNTTNGTLVVSGNTTLQQATTTNLAITNITNAVLSTNANGSVVATTSIGVNYLSGVLPVANGGTATSTQVTNGVNYFDGTRITSGTALTFTGTNLGIGTTTPQRLLSLYAAASPVLQLTDSTAGQSNNDGLLIFQTGLNSFIENREAGSLVLRTQTADRMTIDSNGNVGIGTTTPGSLLSLGSIANFTTATSTFYGTGGFNLAGGCFAINGTCVGGGSGAVSSVSNADGTLTVSPTTGAVVASLNLGNANAWTARQNFTNASTTLLSVFTKAYFGGTATTTIDSAGNLAVAGTLNVTGNTTLANATSTSFAITNITSALPLANSSGSLGAYGGSSCTNQFVRSLNGAGVATCAAVSLTADVTGVLPIANGGTGWANIAANTLLTGNGAGALATTTIGSSLSLSSATLNLNLANSNWWTARQNFTNASTSQLTATSSVWFTGTAASSLLALDENQKLVATTSIGTNLLTGILPIANGGTNNGSAYTAGSVIFSNGTSLTQNNANFFWDNTNKRLGVGSSTPWAKLAVHANNGETNTMLFQIASSTASATTSLFSVDNTGLATVGDSTGTGDANFQFAADANAWSVGYNSTNKSFNIASSTNFSANVAFTILKNNLNVGIGTTTPGANLAVVGDVMLPSLVTATNNRSICWSTTDNRLFAVNAACTTSSIQFKTNVATSTYGLAEVMKLHPVTFNYKPEVDSDQSRKIGFIAEELVPVIPEVGVYDTNNTLFSIDYPKLVSVLTGALQELDLQVAPITSATSSPSDITSSTASSTTPWIASFSDASQSLKDGVNGLADTLVHVFKNVVYAWTGIFNKIFAREVHTDKLCVSDSGGETCVTKVQLDALLASAAVASGGGGAGATASGSGSGAASSGVATASASTPDTMAPIITINGNNPATIKVGDSYADLGASVTDNVDRNLGIHTFVDGTEMEEVQIDTSTAGTHTIEYKATDSAGNIGTATRTVNVVDSNAEVNQAPDTQSTVSTSETLAPVTESTPTDNQTSASTATSTTP